MIGQPFPEDPNWWAILVVLTALPVIIWGAYRAISYVPRKPWSDEKPDPSLAGIDRWMCILAMMVAAIPLRGAYVALESSQVALSMATWRMYTSPDVTILRRIVPALLITDTIANLWLLAHGAVVVILFWKKKSSFPINFMICAAFFLVILYIENFIASLSLLQQVDNSLYARYLWLGLWMIYVRTSRRVAARFVN